MSQEAAEIGDDEIILRRVPFAHCPPTGLMDKHFKPHRTADSDGLSFYRESIVSAETLAATKPGAGVFFAKAADIRQLGLSLVDSSQGNPGHCHIPELRADNRSDPNVREWSIHLWGLFKDNIRIPPQAPPAGIVSAE